MWKRRLIETILERRRTVLLMTALLTGVALAGAGQVKVETAIDIWFVEDDSKLARYRDFLSRFGTDETLVVGLFAEEIFTAQHLAEIDRITRAIENLPVVGRVQSLANLRLLQRIGERVEITELVGTLPTTATEAAQLRDRALASPLLSGLTNKSGTATAIYADLADGSTDFAHKRDLVASIRAIVAPYRGSFDIALAGPPAFDDAFFCATERDLALLGPVSLVVILLTTLIAFRRLLISVVPLAVVLLATTWTFGVMGAAGLNVNAVSASLATLILAIGIADSIHLLSEYYAALAAGHTRNEALVRAFSQLLVPCFFTTATTAAGLLALLASQVGPVREFGALAALGVVFAFCASVGLGPILLLWAPEPTPAYLEQRRSAGIARLLGGLAGTVRRRRLVIAGSGLLVVAGALWAMTGLTVGVNPVRNFRPSDPVRRDTERVEAALGGTAILELLVNAPNGGLKDPDRLYRLDELHQFLESRRTVTHTASIVTLLKEAHRLFAGETATQGQLPTSRAMAAQYYLVLESDPDISRLVQEEYELARLAARTELANVDRPMDVVREVEAKLSADYADGDLRVEPTGYAHVMSGMYTYLLDSQVKSLLLAFVVITAMLALLLRSLRLALFGMIPNVGPILLGLGLMAVFRIQLDVATVMIGSITLGLVVDDTVHFLVRLRRHLSDGIELTDATTRTLVEGGHAIAVTSLVLACGFASLVLGRFLPNVYFGTIAAIIVLLALIADLLVLPAALHLIQPRLSAKH